MKMKRIHYAWYVCFGCALLLFCTSGLSINAFTVYQPYIISENGFSNTQASTIITVRSLFAFISMFLTGIYYKKVSLRKGMCIAGLLIVLGFLFFGMADNYPMYCIGAVCVGFGYGFGTMVLIAIVLEHWFKQKRTLALSICSAITGFSTFGIPTLITKSIESIGLRVTFVAEAGLIFIFTLISFCLVKDTPAEKNILPYGENVKKGLDVQFTSATVIRKKHWLLLVPMLLFIGAMTNVGYSHLAVLVSSEGYEPHLVALAITISGVSLTISKCIYGWSSEKAGTYKSNMSFGVILVFGMILLCFSGVNKAIMIISMFLYGFGLALTTVGLTAWVGDLCSGKEYDKTVRFFSARICSRKLYIFFFTRYSC